MNYKKILIAYIDAVGTQEGVTFTGDTCGLTKEEFAELIRLDGASAQLPVYWKDEAGYPAKLEELAKS